MTETNPLEVRVSGVHYKAYLAVAMGMNNAIRDKNQLGERSPEVRNS